jgi:uncharacterized protein
MNHFIIDGNNLIGRIPALLKLQKKEKLKIPPSGGQSSRERLAFLIERYFAKRKDKVTLHFDGFQNLPVKVSKIKIIYSDKRSADENIKNQISDVKNRKNIIVITSDYNLQEFAKVCGCNVQSSDDFAKTLTEEQAVNEEEERIRQMSNEKNIQEFKDIFLKKK